MINPSSLRRLAGAAILACAAAAPLLVPTPAQAHWGRGWRPAPVGVVRVAPAPMVRVVPMRRTWVGYAPVWVPGHWDIYGRWIPAHWR